jgi:hypothetical protein
MPAFTDITGILDTIDNALSGSSPDAMRWSPSTTDELRITRLTVMFTWDEGDDIGRAVFEDVKAEALDELAHGDVVWVDGRRYTITARHQASLQLTVIRLEPSPVCPLDPCSS